MKLNQRSTDFRCGQRLGLCAHLMPLHKPKVKPEGMTQEHYPR